LEVIPKILKRPFYGNIQLIISLCNNEVKSEGPEVKNQTKIIIREVWKYGVDTTNTVESSKSSFR
jgi:hypothetical protein